MQHRARTWCHRITVASIVVALGLAWLLHSARTVLTDLRREHDEIVQALAGMRSELAGVQRVRRGQVLPLEQAVHEVRRVVSQIQAQGVPLTVTASPRTALTLATLRLDVIPCQVVIHTEALLPVVETLAALEKTQIVIKQVTLTARQGTAIDFDLVGMERRAGEDTATRERP